VKTACARDNGARKASLGPSRSFAKRQAAWWSAIAEPAVPVPSCRFLTLMHQPQRTLPRNHTVTLNPKHHRREACEH